MYIYIEIKTNDMKTNDMKTILLLLAITISLGAQTNLTEMTNREKNIWRLTCGLAEGATFVLYEVDSRKETYTKAAISTGIVIIALLPDLAITKNISLSGNSVKLTVPIKKLRKRNVKCKY